MRIGALLLAFLGASQLHAAERSTSVYLCPKIEGATVFRKDSMWQHFGPEYPTLPENPIGVRVGYAKKKLDDCTSGDYFCLKIDGGDRDIDFDIIVIPKLIRGTESFVAHGHRFEVMAGVSIAGHRPIALITVKRIGSPGLELNKFYVEDGVGVTDIYFEYVRGSYPTSEKVDFEYRGVSCSLKSKKGLFPDVRIKGAETSVQY